MKRAWWIAAPVAVALMLAASSQPYVTVYAPWQWTKQQVLADSEEFRIPVADYPEYTHSARVQVAGFQKLSPGAIAGITPLEGFDVWAVLTQWQAPTDSILAGCQMWSTDDQGTEYPLMDRVLGGVVDPRLSTFSACTPPGEEGPQLEWDMDNHPDDMNQLTLTPGEPRPESWEKLTLLSMPAGTQPEALHIGWDKPAYVSLPLPEPEEFLSEEQLASFAGAGLGAAAGSFTSDPNSDSDTSDPNSGSDTSEPDTSGE